MLVLCFWCFLFLGSSVPSRSRASHAPTQPHKTRPPFSKGRAGFESLPRLWGRTSAASQIRALMSSLMHARCSGEISHEREARRGVGELVMGGEGGCTPVFAAPRCPLPYELNSWPVSGPSPFSERHVDAGRSLNGPFPPLIIPKLRAVILGAPFRSRKPVKLRT